MAPGGGLLVTFDGPSGVGKTTVSGLVRDRLAVAGVPVVLTATPSSSSLGELARHGTSRLALKLAWEQGVLTYRNKATHWNRENRTFGLTAKLYPGLDMSIERDQATGDLIHEYFDRYGPASLRDAMWWSGLSRLAIITAMNKSPRRFIALRAPWCQSPLYMYNDLYERFRDTWSRLQEPALNFLAHEDVALKAYFESRGRYLGKLLPRCAFNQIGEVLPTIVYDGQIVGSWAWDASRMAVTYSIIRSYGSAGLRKETRRQANVLSETLRLRWT
ncbi:MAG: winged helix DNA-binding domain-containing protein [Pseudonocardiales bacterium]|nr:winged helix DNA-binding domain-containing protein [Pseudonocardiales bacterium]